MDYIRPENIVVAMQSSPVFASLEQRIYDITPVEEPTEVFCVLSVISDPQVSEVQGRARLEVRVLFPKETPQYEARAYISNLNGFFVGKDKVFEGDRYYRIECENKQCFIDPDQRRVVFCDYYLYYTI